VRMMRCFIDPEVLYARMTRHGVGPCLAGPALRMVLGAAGMQGCIFCCRVWQTNGTPATVRLSVACQGLSFWLTKRYVRAYL
jgi:hypothetical protein